MACLRRCRCRLCHRRRRRRRGDGLEEAEQVKHVFLFLQLHRIASSGVPWSEF